MSHPLIINYAKKNYKNVVLFIKGIITLSTITLQLKLAMNYIYLSGGK